MGIQSLVKMRFVLLKHEYILPGIVGQFTQNAEEFKRIEGIFRWINKKNDALLKQKKQCPMIRTLPGIDKLILRVNKTHWWN